MCNPKQWFKDWIGITALEECIKDLEGEQHKNNKLYNLVNLGVDVHFNEPHMILIYTKLNGGTIHHIPAKFSDMRDLLSYVKHLKESFRTEEVIYDAPPHIQRWVRNL